MIEISIFIDSNIFIAYYNERDENHPTAKKILNDIISGKYGKPFISDYIFDEVVTVCLLRTKSMELTKKLGEYLLNSEFTMLKVTDTIFINAWRFFSTFGRMSFTDCTNVSFLKTYRITYIATFDKQFKKISGMKVVENHQ